MLQARTPLGPLYAVRRLDGAHFARLPRGIQSAEASRLLGELTAGAEGAPASTSKAHARAMVAAVATYAGQAGIDIEYHQPGRDIMAIARWLSGEAASDEAAAYRLFTFREAFFKAFGDWPARALLLAAREAGAGEIAPGVRIFHETIEDEFSLCLVWSGAGDARRITL